MVAFAGLGAVAGPAVLAGTAGVIGWADCEGEWKALIQRIQRRSLQLAKYARRQVLHDNTGEDGFIAVTGINLPIRSSHGNPALAPAPYPNRPVPMTLPQEAWFVYSEACKTDHCPPNCTPAYIEFHIAGGGGGGLRILYDYMNGGFLITDHYVTYYQITVPGYP